MTDDTDFTVPDSRIDRIKYSITNLWDEFGTTDSPLFGAVWNVSMALVGFIVMVYTDGLVALAGVSWAILHLLAIFKWVVGL